MFSWMADTTRDAWNGMADYVDAAINETPLRIAVTGLSRAGKTVFITSLIHNLMALGKGSGTLPKLQAALVARGRAGGCKRCACCRRAAATSPSSTTRRSWQAWPALPRPGRRAPTTWQGSRWSW
jgi:hypothetical protein